MIEWKEYMLKSITSKIGSGITPKGGSSIYIEKGCALIRSQNIYNGAFDFKGLVFVNDAIALKMKGVELHPNDILINITGDSVARCTIVPKKLLPARVNQHVAIIRCKDWTNPIFVMYSLISPINQARLLSIATGAGATRNALTKAIIEEFKILLPPLPTQRRIASILSAYDDLIENNLKRIKLLEELAQRTYEEWFVKFRINGESLPIDEKTGLPVGWEKRPLNEIAEIISGFAFKSGDYVKDGKYKIVTIKNVQDGYFIPETTDSLIEVPSKVKESQVLKSGDIILSLTGNVGRSCLVFGQNYLLNQRVAKIVAKRPEFYSYIYFLLRSKSMVVALENLSNGAAQQNLSPINMGNYLVTLPDDEVLNKYSNQFNNHIELICQLNNEITLLKESRDILLPRLMSGKINVE